MLQKYSTGYEIQSFSGWYQVVGGRVNSNPFNARVNAWSAKLNGQTEAAFVEQLKAAMQ